LFDKEGIRMQKRTQGSRLAARCLAPATGLVLALGSLGALAQSTATGQFNVNVTLTPKCEVFNTGGATTAIPDLPLSYTSFQTAASTASTNFKVRCTNTLGYGLALDTASLTDSSTGLQLALALSSSAAHSATPTAALSALTGNGNAGQTYYVHGTLAANQDGSSTPGAANNLSTLTISY